MKNKISIALILLTLLLIGGVLVSCNSKDTKQQSITVQTKTMYHCPMHPSYISDKPGACPICGMALVPIQKDQHDLSTGVKDAGKRKIIYYRDAMKPWITSEKPGKASDGMDLVPVYEGDGASDGSGIKIDPTTVQNMGVTTTKVELKHLNKEIRTSATLENDETKVFIVNTKIMGYVEKLFIDFTGQPVKKGQPLLTIYSPDLVSTQEEYLQALRYYQALSGGSQIARDGAKGLVESAKKRLMNWDISSAQIEELAQRGTTQKSMTIFAPASGIVLEKMVIAGQNIEPGMPLYKIADLSRIWTIANVYQEDLPYVKVGMTADVELTSIPGKTFQGKVQFISPVLDMESKTAQVRIELVNTPDYSLKPQMFASVKMLSPISENGVAVPEQAIIHSGKRDVVIVALGNGYFVPQEVKLGATADGYTIVIDGLKEGQMIVTSSQFLIDSESNLRAAVSKMGGPDTSGTAPEKKKPGQEHKGNEMPGMPGMSMDKKTVDNVAKTPASMDGMDMSSGDQVDQKSTTESKVKPAGSSVKGKDVYYCPMEREFVSDKPGKCPLCGMHLVKE